MRKKMGNRDSYEETYFKSDREDKKTRKEMGPYGCR
jgi:hypothetical protein